MQSSERQLRAIILSKNNPNKEGDDCYKHYDKHSLIKHKPWKGLRNTAHGRDDEDMSNVINLWECCVKSVMSSGSTHPNYAQTEIDTCASNKQS